MLDRVALALADPHRREILRMLRQRERPAGEIAARFSVTRPAISQHLGVLVDAGLVTVRREGTRRLYRVRPEGMLELRRYLDEFWDERLLRLKDAAEEEERRVSNRDDERTRDSGNRDPDRRET